MKQIRRFAALAVPLLLFVVLLIPYSWVNQRFLVDWLGCGCPKVDELGNIVPAGFNANDVTFLFWSAVSVCGTGMAFPLSRRLLPEKRWHRMLYIATILVLSLWIARYFCRIMMWN